MKIRVEQDGCITEEEIVIRCQKLNEKVLLLQKTLEDLTSKNQKFVFYKGETEYYLSLEEILPGYFMRISKSTILNAKKVYSIQRNLAASSVVELYFPKSWTVINQTDTSFGGMDEKNNNNSAGSPVVTLIGDISFSGVTIIYV